MAIYLVDSVIQPLNNRGLVDSVIQPLNNRALNYTLYSWNTTLQYNSSQQVSSFYVNLKKLCLQHYHFFNRKKESLLSKKGRISLLNSVPELICSSVIRWVQLGQCVIRAVGKSW